MIYDKLKAVALPIKGHVREPFYTTRCSIVNTADRGQVACSICFNVRQDHIIRSLHCPIFERLHVSAEMYVHITY